MTIPVIAELLFAAKNSLRQEENLAKYRKFIKFCNVISISQETADIYSNLRLKLKKKGRPIPNNDLWIAAQCVENDLVLITGDVHFEYIDNLQMKKI